MMPSYFRLPCLVACELICIASQGLEHEIKMLISSYHLNVMYPVKVSFLWPGAGFFEMLPGEDSADSCSKEEAIGHLVIYVSHGLHSDKEEWPITKVIKCET
jgi:hypothetical protein